jgi:pimeloyl-ACP methyl ester carboxylesterase
MNKSQWSAGMESKIMLLRGLTRGNGHWGDFPEILKSKIPDAEIELMEIPGNGTQNHKKTPVDVEEVIKDIKSRSLFAQQKYPFHLVAISLGGMVALKWAELYPSDLASVTVINSSLKQCSPFYKRLKYENYYKIISTLFQIRISKREKLILKMTSNRPKRIEQFLEIFSAFSSVHKTSMVNFLMQIKLANSIVLIKDIVVPVTIISSLQDRLVDASCSRELSKLTKSRLITHENGGHDLPLDEPNWLCDVLFQNQSDS